MTLFALTPFDDAVATHARITSTQLYRLMQRQRSHAKRVILELTNIDAAKRLFLVTESVTSSTSTPMMNHWLAAAQFAILEEEIDFEHQLWLHLEAGRSRLEWHFLDDGRSVLTPAFETPERVLH